MMVSNRNLLFQGSIFRFHVCFGGVYNKLPIHPSQENAPGDSFKVTLLGWWVHVTLLYKGLLMTLLLAGKVPVLRFGHAGGHWCKARWGLKEWQLKTVKGPPQEISQWSVYPDYLVYTHIYIIYIFFIGYKTTQLHRDYNKPTMRILMNQPGWLMECHFQVLRVARSSVRRKIERSWILAHRDWEWFHGT